MNTTTPAATANPTTTIDQVTEAPPAAQSFLEAVLYKDPKTLREFGVSDAATAAIDIETQINVAQKLLAANNSLVRSKSKKLSLPASATNVTTLKQLSTPAAETARFYSSASAAKAAGAI